MASISYDLYTRYPKIGWWAIKNILPFFVAVCLVNPDKALKFAEAWMRRNMEYRIGENGEWKKAFE